MNEADTRAERIDPQLKAAGWGVVEGSRIHREYPIKLGEIKAGGMRAGTLNADYVLIYKNRNLAAVEAKSDELEVSAGVAQAKNYAEKLHLQTSFASNGKAIYQICHKTCDEGLVAKFPTPDQLWQKTFAEPNEWREKFDAVPIDIIGGNKSPRYYQAIAINKVMEAIADHKSRILLTLATGTGKTFIASQVAWKLFQSRWNLQRDGQRRPRILFLTDRNILANQAYLDFGAFSEDARIRIRADAIKKQGDVPTNASVFFTIFQTFMSGANDSPYFGQYPQDFFDCIIIDECHRGGAHDESAWRAILDYFYHAVQLGLTATPKREDNVNTYSYFGEPVYRYSLKEGIQDGFLTPFRVKRIESNMDEYVYASDDEVIAGEVQAGKVYRERDFNTSIEIKAREIERVQQMLTAINSEEKTLVFCANQAHAASIRDLINEQSDRTNVDYCVRVTSEDGEIGETYLRTFQDNEKTIPTILTTSQKLSTGVDARNIRNIVLVRPINSMIEFKQIIGRGTRLFEGKDYFTIIDFVHAYQHFSDPEWDGEPIEPVVDADDGDEYDSAVVEKTLLDGVDGHVAERPEKLKIRLSDGRERQIQSITSTSFFCNGEFVSAEGFVKKLFDILQLPELFDSEDKLRALWSKPTTRRELLKKLQEKGCDRVALTRLQEIIDAEDSDLFDVLEYIHYAHKPITRQARVEGARSNIYALLNAPQREFIAFVLENYTRAGIDELDDKKLSKILTAKYGGMHEARQKLGNNDAKIRDIFIDFQQYLYPPAINQ